HLAAAKGNLRMVQYLLDHGARANDRDHFGRIPLQYSFSLLVTALLINKGHPSVNIFFSPFVQTKNLIAVDLLITQNPALVSHMEDFRWNDSNVLYNAIRMKNDVM